MKFAEWCRCFSESADALNRGQIAACRFLEKRGLRFLIDFGYENAEDIAWNIMEREKLRDALDWAFVTGLA